MIAKDKAVELNYTLKSESGDVIDSSTSERPFVYLHGHGNIVPGLETALDGKKQGDAFDVTVQPDDAYGQVRPELMLKVEKTNFPEGAELEAGMRFQADMGHGPMVFTVDGFEEEFVLCNGNHPLAGMVLHFDVEVVSIRDASSEEIEHGHIHGPGGHEH